MGLGHNATSPISPQGRTLSKRVASWLRMSLRDKCSLARGILCGWLHLWQFDEHGLLLVDWGLRIRKRYGRLVAGEGVSLLHECRILLMGSQSAPAEVVIGHHTIVAGSTISASISVRIGAHCMIARDCVIEDSNFHRIRLAPGSPPSPVSAPILIEDNVWIGRNCMIMKGAHIGAWCVIGAGSVVRGNIPAHSLVVGNPARRVSWVEEWMR